MYRNLDAKILGISGRQSEMIELALTYDFKGVSIDISEFAARAVGYGVEHVGRFHKSAEIQIGTMELPTIWAGPEDQFKAFLETDIPRYVEVANELGATRAVVAIQPGSDEHAYKDNFELHRVRLGLIADQLAASEIKLGLGLRAAAGLRKDVTHPFIFQAEDLLTLIKTVSAPNVGLWFDAWEWKVGGGTFEQFAEIPVDQIVAVGLADLSSEIDLVEITDSHRLLPGQGDSIDSQAIVNALRDAEYDGPVTPTATRESMNSRTRGQAVREASHALEALWQGAGLSRATAPIAPAVTEEAAAKSVPQDTAEKPAAEGTADAKVAAVATDAPDAPDTVEAEVAGE